MTLVDTNVLIDVAGGDPVWSNWSNRELDAAASRGPIFINDIIYAEFSAGFASLDEMDGLLDEFRIIRQALPPRALFLAGKVFRRYRAAGGTRTSTLPDFFIGAHALVAGIPLLTRDARRYKSYFPTLELISPVGA